MKMSVDEEKKIVELWLTAAEQNDTALMESLKPLYEAWRERQYRPVVFRSGDAICWSSQRDCCCTTVPQPPAGTWSGSHRDRNRRWE